MRQNSALDRFDFTKKLSVGDVYSFAIILQQILLRSPPFRNTFSDHPAVDSDVLTDKELVMEVFTRESSIP